MVHSVWGFGGNLLHGVPGLGNRIQHRIQNRLTHILKSL